MEQGKRLIKHPPLFVLIVLVILGLWITYVQGYIGMSEEAMHEEQMEEIQEKRPLYVDMVDSMAVFLDYREDLTEIDVDIYVKRKHRIGWFFRYGMSSDGPLDYLQQLACEGNEEYVLLYLSADPISHIEVDKGNGSTMTINPEMGKPFAYVMKHGWNVAVYDPDGSVIHPHESNM